MRAARSQARRRARRPVRGGRRRHAVPRRDRRALGSRSRPSCCACSRTARSAASARTSRGGSTSGSWPRPIVVSSSEVAAGRFRAGPAVPARCRPHRGAAAARASGRRAAARQPLLERCRRARRLAARRWRREVVAALARYDWPGNVRELQNVMAWMAVHSPGRGRVGAAALPESRRPGRDRKRRQFRSGAQRLRAPVHQGGARERGRPAVPCRPRARRHQARAGQDDAAARAGSLGTHAELMNAEF